MREGTFKRHFLPGKIEVGLRFLDPFLGLFWVFHVFSLFSPFLIKWCCSASIFYKKVKSKNTSKTKKYKKESPKSRSTIKKERGFFFYRAVSFSFTILFYFSILTWFIVDFSQGLDGEKNAFDRASFRFAQFYFSSIYF